LNNPSSNETDLLDIGYGLRIRLKRSGIWQVLAKNGSFDLIEAADFWRVVTLLERPYSEVSSTFYEYEKKINAEYHFPYWKVVSAGLAFEVDQWASLALTWFPYLKKREKAMLVDLLDAIVHSKWASQKSRQLANRYVKQMRATDV
jgi:hypothetical protein